MTPETSIMTTQQTLWNIRALTYFKDTSIYFFEFVGTTNEINSMKEV
jgi:hypothetical protein